MPRRFRCTPCRLTLDRSGDGGVDGHKPNSTVVGIDETNSNVVSLSHPEYGTILRAGLRERPVKREGVGST
jgi:hypothetical protein